MDNKYLRLLDKSIFIATDILEKDVSFSSRDEVPSGFRLESIGKKPAPKDKELWIGPRKGRYVLVGSGEKLEGKYGEYGYADFDAEVFLEEKGLLDFGLTFDQVKEISDSALGEVFRFNKRPPWVATDEDWKAMIMARTLSALQKAALNPPTQEDIDKIIDKEEDRLRRRQEGIDKINNDPSIVDKEKAINEFTTKFDKNNRPGGDERGYSAGREPRRLAIFRMFGWSDKGPDAEPEFVPCAMCGTRLHWSNARLSAKGKGGRETREAAARGALANPLGLASFEEDKIFTKLQGGTYDFNLVLPLCRQCNEDRGDDSLFEIEEDENGKPIMYEYRGHKFQKFIKNPDGSLRPKFLYDPNSYKKIFDERFAQGNAWHTSGKNAPTAAVPLSENLKDETARNRIREEFPNVFQPDTAPTPNRNITKPKEERVVTPDVLKPKTIDTKKSQVLSQRNRLEW